VPVLPLHFVSWVLSQNDKFYTDASGLWHTVFRHELGLTNEQMTDLLALRAVFKQRNLSSQAQQAELDAAYRQFSVAMRRQMSDSQSNFDRVRAILTSDQLAKFFKWVNTFGHVCIKINT